MIPHLFANSYLKRMDTGRTKPCLFFCGNESGEISGEYVVKLKDSVDGKETGLAFELIASLLAKLLGIPTPEPAIIEIDPVMADVIDDSELAAAIRESAGLNFGSRFMSGGYTTWPVGMGIPPNIMQLAAEIFAFDALIQNPDRRRDKPNLLWKGEEIYIIDHEIGFSFVYAISPDLGFLSEHLFYKGLKGKDLKFDRFAGALGAISDDEIEKVFSCIPPVWSNDKIQKVKKHTKEILGHVDEFIDEVRRLLQ